MMNAKKRMRRHMRTATQALDALLEDPTGGDGDTSRRLIHVAVEELVRAIAIAEGMDN